MEFSSFPSFQIEMTLSAFLGPGPWVRSLSEKESSDCIPTVAKKLPVIFYGANIWSYQNKK